MDVTEINVSGQPIALTIKRHRRARRISLKLSAARDGIIMTLPGRASVQAGMAFLHSKVDWVLASIEPAPRMRLVPRATLTVLGKPYLIHHAGLRGLTRLCDETGRLLVYGDPAFTARRIRDLLKKTLRHVITARAQELAAQIGEQVKSVTIRDTQSRWGSCSARGTLSFTWQLIFAPPPVLDYLIAHEVAHLREMNHSATFWACVRELCPEFEVSRLWLKKEGHSLHRYG